MIQNGFVPNKVNWKGFSIVWIITSLLKWKIQRKACFYYYDSALPDKCMNVLWVPRFLWPLIFGMTSKRLMMLYVTIMSDFPFQKDSINFQETKDYFTRGKMSPLNDEVVLGTRNRVYQNRCHQSSKIRYSYHIFFI